MKGANDMRPVDHRAWAVSVYSGKRLPPSPDASEAEWYAWLDDVWFRTAEPLYTSGGLTRFLRVAGLVGSVQADPQKGAVNVRIRDGRMAMCAALTRLLREQGTAHVLYDVAPEEGTAEAVMWDTLTKAFPEIVGQTFAAAKPVPAGVAEPPTMRRLLDTGKPVRVLAFVEQFRHADPIIGHLRADLHATCSRSYSCAKWTSGAWVRFVKREWSAVHGMRADVIVGHAPQDIVSYLFSGPESMRVHVVGEAAERAFWGMDGEGQADRETDEQLRLRIGKIISAADRGRLYVASGKDLDGLAREYGTERKQATEPVVFAKEWSVQGGGDAGTFVGVDPAAGPSKTATGPLGDYVAIGRGLGKSGMMADRTSRAAAAVAIGEFFTSITRWAATPEGQRAFRDYHVKQACEDVPAGCDAKRWRNVVHVIAAGLVEDIAIRRGGDFASGLRFLAGVARTICPVYGRARFVFRYDAATAKRDTLVWGGASGNRLAERMLCAYEAG